MTFYRMLLTRNLKQHYVEIVILCNKESFRVLVSSWVLLPEVWCDRLKTCPAVIVPLGEVYSCSHTRRHLTSSPCWPRGPDVCHSRWWQSEMALPTRRRSSDKHLSLPSCFFSPLCPSLFLCGLCSLSLCDPLTHDLIGLWQPSKHFLISQWRLQDKIPLRCVWNTWNR